MKSIKRMMPADASIVKDGVDIQVPVCELVVGDVVALANGAKTDRVDDHWYVPKKLQQPQPRPQHLLLHRPSQTARPTSRMRLRISG